MTLYTVVKFIHVTGALGYFIALGVLLFGLTALRRARTVEQVRALAEMLGWVGPTFGISLLVILAAGLILMFMVWSLLTGWILVALLSLIVIVAIAGRVIESRRGAIARLAREAPDGPLTADLTARIQDPVLLSTPRIVASLVLGIVFLMTNKPDWLGAILVMLIALVVGLGWGVLLPRMRATAATAKS